MKSIHWKINNDYIGTIIKKNKYNKKLLLNNLSKYDCITQMDVCIDNNNNYWPQLIDYEQLYQENKDAIFILNKRNPNKILQSFKNWNKLLERFYKYNPELLEDKTDQGFINFVNNHYNNVENFFNTHSDSKFISYDIDKDDISKLNIYINTYNLIFPHINKNYKN